MNNSGLPALWPLMSPTMKGRAEQIAVSAQGVHVSFADGRTLLCGSSGLWNCNLGYGNVAIAEAVAATLRRASYLSVWGCEHELAHETARSLVVLTERAEFGRVLFSTSGGAANDMAMKLVRQYHSIAGREQRNVILGLQGGFHGLTYGAFALSTGQLGQRMYGVDRRLVAHLVPNSGDDLERVFGKIGDRVAAVFVEPVIGSGAIVLDDSYLRALFDMRRKHGFLLVADEVTTGFGRVGPGFFASHAWEEPPDAIIAAKGMTNGSQAASALIVSTAVAETYFQAGAILGHAETQAGSPASCAAVLATIAEMRRLDALVRGARLAEQLRRKLSTLVGQVPFVRAATGRGCLWALHLADLDGAPLDQARTDAVVSAIRDAGALVQSGPSCLQIVPALIYCEDDLDSLLGCVACGLRAFADRTPRVAVEST
ncbi:daptide-type RiPP biosynthesis aminotransferase [Bradyrhizobium sp. vgs-9]|uniref:daptide-type RiPP biosynthesis aminotransferase n=1 Tax=Bradyrhizobium sp. vgs-9 TaxID=208389 RepID=UPI0035D46845